MARKAPYKYIPRITAYEMHGLKEFAGKVSLKPKSPERNGYRSLARLVMNSTSIRHRADVFNNLYVLLEQHPQSVPIALRVAAVAAKGSARPREKDLVEFNERLGNLITVDVLNSKIGKGSKINPEIVLRQNFKAELNKCFQRIFAERFGVERVSIELKPATLTGIFDYYARTSSWISQHELKQGSFEAMVKAFVEKGPLGIMELKFSHKNVPDQIFNFLKGLHTIRVRAGAAMPKQVNLFHDVFSLQLQNFEQHARQEGLNTAKAIADSAQEMKKIAGTVSGILQSKNLEAPAGINKQALALLVSKGQFSELKRVCDALRAMPDSKLTGKQRAFKNAVLGQLTRSLNLHSISDGLRLFDEIKPQIITLQNLGPDAQMEKVLQMRERYGAEKLQRFAELFHSLEKKPGNLAAADIKNIFKSVAEARLVTVAGKEAEIDARITYDLNDILQSGHFGDNCLSAGKLGYPLIGFTLDPQEFFLGYFSRGEYTGFSIIHLMQKGNGFVLYIERPYTNAEALAGQMRESGNGFAAAARQAIQKAGIKNTEVQTSWSNASHEGLQALQSIHANKWYDVLGHTVR